MSIRYASVCDGIGAVHVAARGLGWQCAWTSEIEPYPAAVVEHHFGYPNLGDMLAITETDLERHGHIDLLVGGTPCQSFSVAGLRKGLADPRGNLALRFLQLAGAARPRWVVWENVPGVLSSGGGRDFGTILGALAELGYGFAYRVLDAQFIRVDGHERAVPQQRRRVFVVGYLGDWRRAAAVLFERESLCGNPPPSREAGAGVTTALTCGLGSGGPDAAHAQAGCLVPTHDVAPCLQERGGKGPDSDCTMALVAQSLRADGFDASEDGMGRGTPIVPAYISPRITRNQHGASSNQVGIKDGSVSDCLGTEGPGAIAFDPGQSAAEKATACASEEHCPPLIKAHAVAFQTRIARNGRGQPEPVCPTLQGADAGATSDMRPVVAFGLQAKHGNVGQGHNTTYVPDGGVRRLTPRECERLQGFPDDYTAITFRGKPAADGPRYRALGNSMATNVMRWLWRRIEMVEAVK